MKYKIIFSILGILFVLSTIKSQNLYYSQINNENHIEIQDTIETLRPSFGTVWAPNGTAICTANNHQWAVQNCIDGAGGAYITWRDDRSGFACEVYAQRVDSNGAIKWTSNGIPVCPGGLDQVGAQICSDGAGGAIISWEDWRNGTTDQDVYAQRIDPTGVLKWGDDGVAVCTYILDQVVTRLCSDGAGGVIISWQDRRSGSDFYDIYAQRIESDLPTIPTGDISSGNYYILLTIFSIFCLIIVMKNRIYHKSK